MSENKIASIDLDGVIILRNSKRIVERPGICMVLDAILQIGYTELVLDTHAPRSRVDAFFENRGPASIYFNPLSGVHYTHVYDDKHPPSYGSTLLLDDHTANIEPDSGFDIITVSSFLFNGERIENDGTLWTEAALSEISKLAT